MASHTGTRVRRVVDLSHPVDERTQVYPGDPRPSFTPARNIERDGFNLLHVQMGSQTGTHADAPYHFFPDGARIDDLDLSMFLGPAVIADVRGKAARAGIEWSDLERYAGALAPGVILVLHTGWSAHWGTPRYFEHPWLHPAAAERIVGRGVRTVAVDACSVDETVLEGLHPTGFAAHHVVLGAGGVIVENLTNVAALDFPDPLVSVLPIRLAAADGAPVRAVGVQLRV